MKNHLCWCRAILYCWETKNSKELLSSTNSATRVHTLLAKYARLISLSKMHRLMSRTSFRRPIWKGSSIRDRILIYRHSSWRLWETMRLRAVTSISITTTTFIKMKEVNSKKRPAQPGPLPINLPCIQSNPSALVSSPSRSNFKLTRSSLR
jgi:hypothetical protein